MLLWGPGDVPLVYYFMPTLVSGEFSSDGDSGSPGFMPRGHLLGRSARSRAPLFPASLKWPPHSLVLSAPCDAAFVETSLILASSSVVPSVADSNTCLPTARRFTFVIIWSFVNTTETRKDNDILA